MKSGVNPDGIYPTPPGEDVVAALREHCRLTASPETFPGITNTAFPKGGEVAVLFSPLSVDSRTRGGTRVPCPICNRKSGKWLSGGTFIWSEATQGVYVIGPDCYVTLDKTGRIQAALNAYNVTAMEKRRTHSLAEVAGLTDELIAWIAAVRGQAEAASRSQSALGKQLPRVRKAIHNVLKVGPIVTATWEEEGRLRQEVLGRIDGAAFLTGRWDLPGKLATAEATLRALRADAGDDVLKWAATLSPTARQDRLYLARAVVSELITVRDRINTASAFLAPANVQVLARWSVKGPPTDFSATHTAAKLTLSSGGASWESPIGLKQAPELPTGIDRVGR